MKRKTLALVGIAMTVIIVFSVAATATVLIPSMAKVEEKTESPTLDKQAPPDLQKVVFIHYKKDKGSGRGGDGKGPKAPKCYDFIGKNVRWKNAENYYVSSALDKDVIDDSVNTWNSETSSSIFGSSSVGEHTWGEYDNINSITLGTYGDPKVIAVTAVWWNPRSKAIVEYDIKFVERWGWGNGADNLMDLQNIATHEFGHAAGLDDIYKDACSEVTMYGYSDYGETKKRDLEEADITGIQELYGA
ncbi:MAG TPA: matrixin family metalloprotease [Methanophagales archaeon]|nr:matrixin family metalloprotease [Methanophagales archaeon]